MVSLGPNFKTSTATKLSKELLQPSGAECLEHALKVLLEEKKETKETAEKEKKLLEDKTSFLILMTLFARVQCNVLPKYVTGCIYWS